MIHPWKASLHVSGREARILIRCIEQGDLIKARLPLSPHHPRALLTMLEGLALWQGKPLGVAWHVTGDSAPWLGSAMFGDEPWPCSSQLVQFNVVDRARRRRRIEGVGEFAALRETP